MESSETVTVEFLDPDKVPTWSEHPLASGYMTYPGNCERSIHARIASRTPMGPNYLGEHMWPVSAEYSPVLCATRVGFSLTEPGA